MLESIIHWHKQALSGDNMQMVSVQQIADYQTYNHP